MESGKPGLGWGWKTVSAISSTMLIVAGAYAWNGLTATAGDTLLASKWNELVDRTEPVMAQYYMSTEQSLPNGPTSTMLNFNTKEYDTHNAVTTWTNWKFTVPVSGTYRVTTVVSTKPYIWGSVSGGSATSITNSVWIGLAKNGSWVKSMAGQYPVTHISTNARLDGSATVKAVAGDTLGVLYVPWRGGVNTNIEPNSSDTWIAIERVGP